MVKPYPVNIFLKTSRLLFFRTPLLWALVLCLGLNTSVWAQPLTYQPLPDNFNDALQRSPLQVAFTRTPAQLQSPVLPKAYRLDSEDQLTLDLQSPRIAQTHAVTVNEQGFVFIPRLGTLSAKGLTREGLAEQIQQQVRQRFGDNSLRVSVFLRQPRPIQVLVSGQVVRPGYHRVPQGTPVLELLRMAGGVLDTGSVMAVQWQRSTATRSLNLWRFYEQGEANENPMLQAGDHIHVPSMPYRLMALGAFSQPGVYEIPTPRVSAQDFVAVAGGVKPNASRLWHWPQLLQAGQGQGARAVTAETMLMAEDALYAPPQQVAQVSRSVLVQGMVKQPGSRPWQQGQRVLDLLEQTGGAQPNADLSQVQLSRYEASTGQRKTQIINVQAYLNGADPELHNPVLAAGDVITVPENFFNIRNISELTTLLISALGIVSVIINLSAGGN